MGEILSLLGTLLIVGIVLFLAYGFTRYIASGGAWGRLLPSAQGRSLQVLEQLPVGKDQKLLVVQMGARYFLLGTSPAGFTKLAELTAEEAALWTSQSEHPSGAAQRISFRDSLSSVLGKKRK